MSFWDNAQGDPTRSQRRIAPQSLKGIPSTVGFVDIRSNGGPLGITPSKYKAIGIKEGGLPLGYLEGGHTAGAVSWPLGDLDPGSLGQSMIIANLMQRIREIDGGNGLNTIVMSPTETTAYDPLLTLLDDSDVGLPIRVTDVRVGGLSLTAGPNTNCLLTPTLALGAHDFHGAVVQTSGDASTSPLVRYTWAGNTEPSSTDTDIYLTCTASSGSNRTLKAKIGAAGDFTSAPTFVVAIGGDWVDALAGSPADYIGAFAEHIQVALPAGATVVVGAIWQVPRRRARWTASYAPERRVSSVSTRVLRNGGAVTAERGWNLACQIPGVVRDPDTGGRQPTGTSRSGDMDWTLQLTRRLADILFQRPLINGETVDIVLQAKHEDRIGTSGVRYGDDIVLPKMLVEGPIYTAAVGGTQPEEAVQLRLGTLSDPYDYNGIELTSPINWIRYTDHALSA